MGHLNRLQRRLLPHTNTGTIQKISEISRPRSDIPIQSPALWSVHSTFGVHGSSQGSKVNGHTQGYKDPPVPRWLVGESQVPSLSPAYQGPAETMPGPGLDNQCRKLRAGTETSLRLCRLPIRSQIGSPERWQNLKAKIQAILAQPSCPVRQFMSLIGLLTATEKQVYLGWLHMRPIQWHLKNNWRVPESLEKVIPIPTSLHPHLEWWLEEDNVLQGQPLHPLKHALQIFTDASKEGWGAHLDEHTTKGVWSLPESKLHINYLELKAVLLALRDFQQHIANQIVLVATDNTTVVSYINKEGGMRSGGIIRYGKSSYSQSLTHSRPVECGSGQAIQTRSDNSNGMVSPHRGFS